MSIVSRFGKRVPVLGTPVVRVLPSWHALIIVAWIALAVYLTLIPRPPFPPGISTRLSGLTAHALVHAGLSYLLFLWMGQNSRSLKSRALAALAAVGLSGVAAVGIELAQHNLTAERSAQVDDISVGVAAALLGALVGLFLSRTPISNRWQWRGVALFVVAGFVTTGTAFAIWDPSLPRVGDHWHAAYTITICGQRMPPLPGAFGDVHTHGDGLIHVHPFNQATAGRNATLVRAFAASGAAISDDHITLPDGARFANGDACAESSSPGQLTIGVNGIAPFPIAEYVPSNGDVISIEFR